MNRSTAARFSFLLSTPVIAGAAVKELPKLYRMQRADALGMPMSHVAIGVAISAIVGYLVVAFFLQYLQTRPLKIFIYYWILFGMAILALAYLHMGSAR
jgi:undecaprenyl-diphosphatase